MSYKVYKSQNYFVVHDNATSIDVIRQVRNLVRWEKKGTLYSFYYNTPNLTTSGNAIIRLGSVYEFSDLVDSSGTAWGSQASLDLYLEQWTGHICCNTAGEDALYDVQNTDGTSLRTGAIPSGETTAIEIPDISFTDSTGITSSVPAGVDIIATACGGGLDSDAQAFLTATSITDMTIIDAVNHLVIDLKNGGIWTKLHAIYPFVGGTATTHKFNLKNPLDTNGAFRLTFGGGWTHSATGAKPNGTNAYADTHLIPSTNITSIDDFSFGVYLRDNVDEVKTDMGCVETYNNYMYGRYAGSTYYTFGSSALNNWATSDSRALFVFNRRNATNSQGYQNITKKSDTVDYNASRGLATCSMYLGARNVSGTGGQFSSKEQAFAFIGTGLTDIEVTYLYSAIQLFNNRLSRAI